MFIDPRMAGRTAKNFGSITKVTYGLAGNDASLARSFAQEVAKRSALSAQSKIPVPTGVTVSKPLVPNTGTPSPVVSGTAQKLAIARGVAGFLAIAALTEVGARTIAAAGEMSQSILSAAEAELTSAQASERLAEAKLKQALQRDRERKQRQRNKQKSEQEEAINRALAPRTPPTDLPLGHPDNPFPTGQTVQLMIQILEANGTPSEPQGQTIQNVVAVRVVRSVYIELFQVCEIYGRWYSSILMWRPADDTSHNGTFASPPRGYLVNSSITIGGKTYTGTPAQIVNPPYLPENGQVPPANNPPSNFKPPTLGKGLGSQLGEAKPKSPSRVPQQQKQENPTPTPSSPVSQKPDLPAPSQPPATGSTQKGRSFIEINGQKIFLDESPKQSFIEFDNGDVVDLSNRPKTPSYIEFANGRRVNLEPQKTPSFIEIGGKRINLDNKPNEPSFMEVNGVRTYFAKDNQPSFIEINGVRTYLPSAAPTAPATTPTTPKSPEKQEEERRAVPFTPTIPNTPTETPRIPTVPPQPINPVQPNPNNVPIPIPNTTPINPTQPTPTPNPTPTPTQPPNSTPTNPPPNLADIIQLTALAVGGIDLLKQGVNNLTNKVDNIDANTSPESLANAAQTGSCRSLKDANCTTPLKDSIVNPIQQGQNNLLNNVGNLASVVDAVSNKIDGVRNFLDKMATAMRLDKVYNFLTFITVIHNASMLSQNLAITLMDTLSLGLATFGIKDENGSPIDIQGILNKSLQDTIKGIIGEANYTTLTTRWAQAVRVYQAGANIVYSMRSLWDSARSLHELTAANIGRIGNALKRSGTVLENSYPAMAENPVMVNNLMTRLQNLEDAASHLSAITSESYGITQTVAQIRKDQDDFKRLITEVTNTPTPPNIPNQQIDQAAKTASVSPPITVQDLVKPEP